MGELKRDVGLLECNKQIIGLLRNALASQGKTALALMPEGERGTSSLITSLGRLLQSTGDLHGSSALHRQAMEAGRLKLGEKHPDVCPLARSLLEAYSKPTRSLLEASRSNACPHEPRGGLPDGRPRIRVPPSCDRRSPR